FSSVHSERGGSAVNGSPADKRCRSSGKRPGARTLRNREWERDGFRGASLYCQRRSRKHDRTGVGARLGAKWTCQSKLHADRLSRVLAGHNGSSNRGGAVPGDRRWTASECNVMAGNYVANKLRGGVTGDIRGVHRERFRG